MVPAVPARVRPSNFRAELPWVGVTLAPSARLALAGVGAAPAAPRPSCRQRRPRRPACASVTQPRVAGRVTERGAPVAGRAVALEVRRYPSSAPGGAGTAHDGGRRALLVRPALDRNHQVRALLAAGDGAYVPPQPAVLSRGASHVLPARSASRQRGTERIRLRAGLHACRATSPARADALLRRAGRRPRGLPAGRRRARAACARALRRAGDRAHPGQLRRPLPLRQLLRLLARLGHGPSRPAARAGSHASARAVGGQLRVLLGQHLGQVDHHLALLPGRVVLHLAVDHVHAAAVGDRLDHLLGEARPRRGRARRPAWRCRSGAGAATRRRRSPSGRRRGTAPRSPRRRLMSPNGP